jgi:hypothetical protein
MVKKEKVVLLLQRKLLRSKVKIRKVAIEASPPPPLQRARGVITRERMKNRAKVGKKVKTDNRAKVGKKAKTDNKSLR